MTRMPKNLKKDQKFSSRNLTVKKNKFETWKKISGNISSIKEDVDVDVFR